MGQQSPDLFLGTYHGGSSAQKVETEGRVDGRKRPDTAPDAGENQRHDVAKTHLSIQNNLVILDNYNARKPAG
jgi:hypothetical protein